MILPYIPMDAQALLGIACVVHAQVGLAWLQCP